MYLARVQGTVVAAVKHSTLAGCRLVLVQREEINGTLADEPNLVVDWQGAALGSTVIVSTDGDIARTKLGNTTPARMVVIGIVDAVRSHDEYAAVNA